MKPESPDKDSCSHAIRIEIDGLDEIFATALDQENMLCKYERFTEHVILSCAMPEIPRYTLQDEDIEGTSMPQAFDLLDKILVRYRRMTAWMRQNGIDPENIAGKGEPKSKS